VATVEELVTFYAPQFAGEDDAIATALELASTAHNATFWGAVFAQAMAAYAAHLLILRQREIDAAAAGSFAAPGPVVSQRAGDLGIGYGAPSVGAGAASSDDALRTTTAGREYLRLRSSRPRTRSVNVGA